MTEERTEMNAKVDTEPRDDRGVGVLEAIRARRSIKEFTDRPIGRVELEPLLDAAVWAPNHRMTEPWRFIVLGEEARRGYAEIRARMKSENVDDEDAAEAVRAKVRRRTLAIPALIAVAQHADDDPVIRREDYAATWMAIQNMLLAAVAHGLGGYIHTGDLIEDPKLRELLELPDEQRLVAVVDVGEPADVPEPKRRAPAAERTRWLS